MSGLTTGGLRGDYFNGSNFETFVLGRTDSSINFNWGSGSPAAGVTVDAFSVRWTGYIIPRYTETYVIYPRTGDGVRLWLNGTRVVNAWWSQDTTERSVTIALTAGQPVAITMEFFEKWYTAEAYLSWSSASQPKEIIPASQLALDVNAPTSTPTLTRTNTPTPTATAIPPTLTPTAAPTLPPPFDLLVESDAPTVTQIGGWTLQTSPTGASGGSYLTSWSADAVLVLPFSGSGFDVIYVGGPIYGSFDILLDGAVVATINSFTVDYTFGQRYHVSGLPATAHELRIVPHPGYIVALDAFAVPALPAPTATSTNTAIPTAQAFPTLALPTATFTPTLTPTPQPLPLPVIAAFDVGADGWVSSLGWALVADTRPGHTGLLWQLTALPSGVETLMWDYALDLRLAQSPRLSFETFYAGSVSAAVVQVQGDSGNWDTVATLTPASDWQMPSIDLSAYTGQVIHLRFVWQVIAPPQDIAAEAWLIDLIIVQDLPPTPTPTFTPTAEPPTATPTDLPTATPTPTAEPPTPTPTETPITTAEP